VASLTYSIQQILLSTPCTMDHLFTYRYLQPRVFSSSRVLFLFFTWYCHSLNVHHVGAVPKSHGMGPHLLISLHVKEYGRIAGACRTSSCSPVCQEVTRRQGSNVWMDRPRNWLLSERCNAAGPHTPQLQNSGIQQNAYG
jgi:hypothetical protein